MTQQQNQPSSSTNNNNNNGSNTILQFSLIQTTPAFIYPEFHTLFNSSMMPYTRQYATIMGSQITSTNRMPSQIPSDASDEQSQRFYSFTKERHEEILTKLPQPPREGNTTTTSQPHDDDWASTLHPNYTDITYHQNSLLSQHPRKYLFIQFPSKYHTEIVSEVKNVFLQREILLESVQLVYGDYEAFKRDLKENFDWSVTHHEEQEDRMGERKPRLESFRIDVSWVHKRVKSSRMALYRDKYIQWIRRAVQELSAEQNPSHSEGSSSSSVQQPVVSLKEPQVIFTLSLEFDKHSKEFIGEYFGRLIGESNRKFLLGHYALNQRNYIGTTSMTPLLSFLCANQALIKEGDLVLDPFVGTGSLLVASAHLGAHVIGNDLDIRVLKGKDGNNLHSNFKQYGLEDKVLFDVFRSCLSQQSVWHGSEIFDAIVTDPPYGKRESASKIGRRKNAKYSAEEELERDHIPSRVQYDRDELMADFLNLCARLLKVGGRLVYWLISDVKFDIETDLPRHPCFKLICISEDRLAMKYSRRLITMEKICSFEEGTKRPQSKSEESNLSQSNRTRSPLQDERERKKMRV